MVHASVVFYAGLQCPHGVPQSSRLKVGVGLGEVVITLRVVTPLCCVVWINYNVVKGHVGRGPVSVARTMAEHRPPAHLGNPTRTPLTLSGHAFMDRLAVTERKGNKRKIQVRSLLGITRIQIKFNEPVKRS